MKEILLLKITLNRTKPAIWRHVLVPSTVHFFLHPEHAHVKAWLGGGYDPLKFDLAKTNKELPKFKSYMKNWR